MNTHIIIPIKDFEELVATAKEMIKTTKLAAIQDQYIGAENTLAYLKLIGKQISLDEKDIEEKAQKIYPALDFRYRNFPKKEAYKQALKDLL